MDSWLSLKKCALAAVITLAAPLMFGADNALAQPAAGIYAPGEPIVTGFSGTRTSDTASMPGNPDKTFIDLDGSSMVIEQVQPNGAPTGQLVSSSPEFAARAKDVGQVFGIALDDAQVPNIYLTATSAFGLQIVSKAPDGTLARLKVGAPGASFMPGQWGSAGGATGSPGSIWKVNGKTGAISLFSTIAANTGAGLGDIVFDQASEQFFVSDLDTGLIYRLGLDGTILGTFDHGVAGRPAHGLASVADDDSAMDITKSAFNSENPKSWGFAQPERKVYGLGVHDGRLYYAVAAGPSVWSVAINPDGSVGDARWELDITGLPSGNEVTKIVFDPEGRMILAQRGPQVGSYDYSVFAIPKTSSVVRYSRELPDDPATPSAWVQTPDSYAIGFRPDGDNATGGIALGYDSAGGVCSQYLWSTGDSLRDNPSLATQIGAPAQVAGLQGNDEALVRPRNNPPLNAYFIDYDGNTGDDQAQFQGHVGDVEIWQNCQGQAGAPVASGQGGAYSLPPTFLPPPSYVPPKSFDLSLTKWANPAYCADEGSDWSCTFVIRAENAGTTPYWGPLTINDWLPANPPGVTMAFGPAPQWSCAANGSAGYQCDSNSPQLLFPGDSVDLKATVKLPKSYALCVLDNNARIVWPFTQDDNPADDFAAATALIDQKQCQHPPGNTTSDLQLSKTGLATCEPDPNHPGSYACDYALTVTNLGPGPFNGPLIVTDALPGGMTNVLTSSSSLTCSTSGSTVTCSLPAPASNAVLGTNWSVAITGDIPGANANGKPICNINNIADITVPNPGDPVLDTGISNDHAEWPSSIDNPKCQQPPGNPPNITVTKTLKGCVEDTSTGILGFVCVWDIGFANSGSSTYSGPLTFTDTSANATMSSLTTGFPQCAAPADNVSCNFVGTSVPPGVSDIPTETFYPASPTLCSVDNTISLTVPAPGSTATAHADLTAINPACSQGPAAALSLTKAAITCPSGLNEATPEVYACYQVEFKNTGTTPYSGPIEFTDRFSVPPADVIIGDSPGPKASCKPTANGYDCTADTTVSLQPQETVSYRIYGGYADNSGGCDITNTAMPSGSLTGASSSATETLAGFGCREDHKAASPPNQCPLASRAPVSAAAPDGCCLNGTWDGRGCSTSGHPKPFYPNLTISKLPGPCVYKVGNDRFLCSYTIVVKNTGTGGVGPVVVKDHPVISSGMQLIHDGIICQAAMCHISWLPAGGTSTILVTLSTSASAVKLSHCQVPNTAAIVEPYPGVSASATDLALINDPACKQPGPSSNGGPTPSNPNPAPKPPLHLVPGIVLQCPAHSAGKYQACTCDRGYHKDRSGKTCVPNSTGTSNPPVSIPKTPVIVPRCPQHSIGNPPACFCVRGYVGYPNCVPLQIKPGILIRPGILPGLPGRGAGPAALR